MNGNNFVDELKEYFNSQTEEEKEKEWQRMSEWNNVGPFVEEWLKSANQLRNTEEVKSPNRLRNTEKE